MKRALRDKLLQREEFDSLEDTRQKILNRPHSALGYRTPMEVWNEHYSN